MFAGAALNLVLMIALAVCAMGAAFVPVPELVAFLAALTYPCLLYHISNSAGDQRSYREPMVHSFYLLIWLILVFATVYWQHGLLVSGRFREVSFVESIYFSVTTWTTLGYGDMGPPERIRHITSIQALMGYIGTGIWVAVAGLWISEKTEMRRSIHKHNQELIMKRIKDDVLFLTDTVGIDNGHATNLVVAGITTAEEIASVSMHELVSASKVSEDACKILRKKAKSYLSRRAMGDLGDG